MKHLTIWFSLLILIVFAGCKIQYTFSGTTIPENVKTVSVDYFENQAALTNPNFPQILTEGLKDKFIRETRLKLAPSDGDLYFKGIVTNYNTTPVAITGNETAAITRLTVTINVTYENKFDELSSFQTSFTRFADFDATQTLSSVESALMTEIANQLIQDVFNKAFLNW